MRECNACANHKCRTMSSSWPKMRTRHLLDKKTLEQNCSRHTPLDNFTTTMFEALMKRNPASIVSVLKDMDMRFVETKNRPYFSFTW